MLVNAVNAVIASGHAVLHHRQTNIDFSSYATAKCKKCTILSSSRLEVEINYLAGEVVKEKPYLTYGMVPCLVTLTYL